MQAANEKDPHGRALIEKNDLGGGVRSNSYSSKTKLGGTFFKLLKTLLCVLILDMLRCGRFYQCYFCIPALHYSAITRYLNDPNK